MRVLKKLPVKSILEPLYPMKGTLRTVKIATPDKHGEEHLIGVKAEPLVAFNKPRLPPVLGPLFVLSFLEMSSSNDGDD